MRFALLIAAVALAIPARAQTPDAQQPPPDAQQPPPDASETEGQSVKDQQQRPVRTEPSPAAKDEAPGTVHTVVPGDTLWDLSQRYLGSPWYWPKVWSYNPQIANPHWIYPGNQVRFSVGTGEEPPGQVEIEPGSGTMGEGDFSLVEPVEDTKVTMIGPKPYEPKGRERMPRAGFVTDKELERTGTLAKSFAETVMLSTGDIVYLVFPDRAAAVVGKDYVIYRPDRKVYHPRSGRLVGYMTMLLGRARVLQVDNPYYVRAQISFAYDSMYRGDLVGPAGEPMVLTVAPVPNTNPTNIEGAVVAAMDPYITVNGERDEVVVDLGSAEGVQNGNVFTIIRQADPQDQAVNPALNQDPHLPAEVIGTCIAAEVKEHATVCMLVRTVREIVAGDRMLFQAGAKTPVSAR
jgi:LysM repeat protein